LSQSLWQEEVRNFERKVLLENVAGTENNGALTSLDPTGW